MSMACSLSTTRAVSPLGPSTSRQGASPACRLPRPPQRRRPRQSTVCLSSDLLLSDGPSTAQIVAQLASGVAWAGVLWMASRLLLQQGPAEEDGPRQECESCGGTGYVDCWCGRWSDGDGGCGTCGGSKRMICSACRGGGTAVPIEARIIIRNERTSNFREYK